MNKKILLFAIGMIVGAWGKLYAQEDVTDTYLQNADLSTVNSGWTYYSDAFKYTDWKTDGDVPVVEFYSQWNAGAPVDITQKDFKFSQTVTLPAGDYRLAVNAFYRNGGGDGTNADKAWIFVKGTDVDQKQNVVALTSAGVASYTGSNDLYKAANAFFRGDFSNAFDFSIASETEVEIGFQGFFNLSLSWCILGPVKLYKYSLDDYLVDYRAKVADAEALYSSPMNATVLADLQDAVKDESSFSRVAEITAAIQTLTDKIAAANTSVAEYAATNNAFNTYDAKAAALDADGKAAYDAAVAAIKSAYNDRSMEGNQAEAVKTAYQEALKMQTAAGSNFTECAPTTWVGQTGGYAGRAERYNASDYNPPYLYTGDVMTQTIEGMPEGAYKVVLEATASFTSGRGFTCQTGDNLAAVFANGQKTNLAVVDRGAINSDAEYGPIEVIGKVGADGVLKYGITKLAEDGGNWFVVNLVSITKVEYIPVTAINASDMELEMLSTAEIGATVTPSDATFPKVTYISANEEIAAVDANGVVTGVAVGSTTITMSADDITKDITVNVVAPAIVPESISLDPAEVTLQLGATPAAAITATVLPAEANQEVIFASADESIATVDAQGNVTATGIGTTTITVTSKTKDDVTATATVTVSAANAPTSYAEGNLENKNYWIKNAATGQYLGGANNWGTRASLIEHGIPFKAAKADEGVYTLDSYTSNGGDSHFLAGEWIDGAATNFVIQPNNNGTFSIGDGTKWLKAKTSNTEVDYIGNDANDPFAQWYFLSMDDRINMLEDGTDTDATFFIKDFNLSRNNTQYAAWEKTNGITNAQNPDNNGGANHYNWNAERYHNTFAMSQIVTLPNGTYKLTAQGFYRQDGQDNDNLPVFFANDQEVTFPVKTGAENSMNEAAASFSKGLYKIKPITVEVTDHTLKIGAKNDVNMGLWCIWDNFELEAVEISDKQTVDVAIGNVQYATLYYSNLNLEIPEGVTAFVVSELNGRKLVTQDVVDVIPAATGVILNGPNATHEFNVIYDCELPAYENLLQGTDEETTISEEGKKYYMLSTNKAGDPASVGLYFYTADGTSIKNKAHKAYLAVDANSTNANAFLFEDADGINSIKANAANGDVYTISGTKVNGKVLTKGVYIVDGKKVVIK